MWIPFWGPAVYKGVLRERHWQSLGSFQCLRTSFVGMHSSVHRGTVRKFHTNKYTTVLYLAVLPLFYSTAYMWLGCCGNYVNPVSLKDYLNIL